MTHDLASIAAGHGFSPEAARHVLDALARGGGRMAQFDHPELGGMGQWHAGGMTMIGEMFNHGLKSRVASLCADLLPLAGSAGEAGAPSSSRRWWPGGLGRPSATGSQNDARYAVFPETARLAVEAEGRVTLYDTGDHRIAGVSQQQSRGRDLSFSSQHGAVRLDELGVVGAPGRAEGPAPSSASDRGEGGDVLAIIERLADLRRAGALTGPEFAAKKAELLSRL